MPMTSLWIDEFVGFIFMWITGIQSSSASYWISLVKAEVKTDGHVFSKEWVLALGHLKMSDSLASECNG